MRSGRPVSVPDIAADDRYAHLHETYASFGVAGLVTLPLGPPVRPIGVLTAFFTAAHAFDEDDVHLLTAYTRQASTTVARALAFDQERRAAERLAEADQLKSDFVSAVTHELRTPLTAMSGFVDTMRLHGDQLDDTTKQQLLDRAAQNATKLGWLIDQVLAFSALEADGGAVRADARPYELGRGLADLVDEIRPALQDCPVRLDVDPDLWVLAGNDTVHHVVGNLLSNASKFAPPGSPITVVARADGSVCRLSVTDRGPGIAAEDQERIFDRFYRGAATRSIRGTGIGLSIVRASVEAVGGTVSVRSIVGEGSTFEVTLPLAAAPVDAATVVLA
jgi:signal transduction histidine kinase